MEANEKILKIISNETIGTVNNISIVTPTIYKSIFTQHASSHNTDIKQEDKLTDTILNDKILKYQDIQEQTVKNAVKLSDSTTRAISAIQDKDENRLSEVLQETQELRKEIEKLKEAVYKDELTHSYNRKWLHDTYLQENISNFKVDGTLAIIDLNYFKIVNDTYGHIVGDKVLIFIANQLRKSKQSVIRYGGDEFIIIFSKNISENSALKMLSIIREDIIHKKLKANDSAFRVSFSIGVSKFQKDEELETVIERADKNMYDDKIQIKKKITGI